MAVVDAARALIEPIAVDHQVELVDVTFGGGILQVLIDREGGLDIDSIADVSSTISRALDHAEVISSKYSLEVSSPGLERPLRTPEQFQRFVGTKINVKLRVAIDGERRLVGILTAADTKGFSIERDGVEKAFVYDDVEKARTVFDWDQPKKPGKAAS